MKWFVLLLAVLLGSYCGSAQQPAPVPAPLQAETPALNSPAGHVITIDAVVSDKSGNPVAGLQQQDFKLLDNKQPVDLLSFQALPSQSGAANPPIQIVLLVDGVNASFETIALLKNQLQALLTRNGGQLPYPMSIDWLTDQGLDRQDHPTTDAKTLAADIDQNEARLHSIYRSAGFNGDVERYQVSVKALDQIVSDLSEQPGRKLVIWLSGGWPLLTGPQIHLNPNQMDQIFHGIVALSTELRSAQIALYSLDPLGAADAGSPRLMYSQQFLGGVKSPRDAHIANLSLQVLSEQSGGRMCLTGQEIADEIQHCIDDARAYYLLSFRATRNDSKSPYHALTLRVDKPGLAVHTRYGYYEEP